MYMVKNLNVRKCKIEGLNLVMLFWLFNNMSELHVARKEQEKDELITFIERPLP